MKDNSKADISHTDDFEQMYQEMVKQAEDKYREWSEHPETAEEAVNYYRTGKIVSVIFNDANYEDKVELNLGNYEIKEEGGKWFAVKKKKEYPKTYEECAEIIAEYTGSDCNPKGCMGYKSTLLTTFQKLLICRDAYWKIAGEEMGLGKPWKPDFLNDEQDKFYLYNYLNNVLQGRVCEANEILVFPTEGMRDTFYENFKELIEECKELL